ncbi:lysine acetyltransferase [Staphylotrichum tortipilum]|uniref:Lysine acetyltransferase n=1 Tax=Staphylotrichum tortipilum TaxID=2831512 RepID=A0AAN6ME19_9PEZI|nr:lysine acetyltransferase [Staphylotrichum longicolle]
MAEGGGGLGTKYDVGMGLAERERTCTLTHPKWGPALSRRDYLLRENYLTTVPLARDGGITHWILTVAGLPAGERPILSSCESLRKRAVYCDGGKVVEGVAHGIGSVFTEEGYRGRGYASRMMREVAGRLRGWQAGRGVVGGEGDEDGVARGRVLFSVLYSDIGKSFYAKHGWEPFESCHVAFEPAAGKTEGGGIARPIGYHELAELCAVDERLLRAELSRGGGGRGRKKTRVAVLPELDALLWHLMREDYMTKCIFGKTPTVRGAVAGEPGRRVWAVWMRGYYGGLNKDEGNTLHVLRVVVEDAEQADEELVDGFRSIVQMAQGEAAEWKTQDVQVWNPTAKVRGLMDKCGIEFEVVERDVQSIASLMWYGEGSTDEVEWVANEKYAWC